MKLALTDDYSILDIGIKDDAWFAYRKAKQETLALTKRNYELAKSQYDKWINAGSKLFVKEVHGTAAWRRMKTNHAASHQILRNLQYFKAFKTGTYGLTDEASKGAVSYWINTKLTPHEKQTMVAVLNGLYRLLRDL
jgi:hypothetical protein